jgi:hypothetical protein
MVILIVILGSTIQSSLITYVNFPFTFGLVTCSVADKCCTGSCCTSAVLSLKQFQLVTGHHSDIALDVLL